MVRRSTRILIFLLFNCLLILTMSLAWEFPASAQNLPGLSMSDDEITSESYVPVFTRGNLDIAPIFLDGKIIGAVSSFIELESDKGNNRGSSYSAATRSHLIHSKLQKILGNMNRYSQEVLANQGISEIQEQEKELRKQLVTNVSEEKGNVFISITFPQNDVPEIIYQLAATMLFDLELEDVEFVVLPMLALGQFLQFWLHLLRSLKVAICQIGVEKYLLE